MREIGQRLVWVSYLGFEAVLRVLPVEVVVLVGRLGGLLAWLVAGKYRRIAARNVRIAYGGELGRGARSRLVRRHFVRLGGNLMGSAKLATMTREGVARRVDVEGLEEISAVASEGRGAVYAIPHMGAWELLSHLESALGVGMAGATLYQPLSNPHMDAMVKRRRAASGCLLFDRHDGFLGPQRHLRGGGGLGVLFDQHAGDAGVWCPLFGRLASTTHLPLLLAGRAGSAVLVCAVLTSGLGRWRVVFRRSAELEDRGLGIEQRTALLNGELEALVRRSPEDWFWVHQRWKTPRPNFLLRRYRRGVSLPPGMGTDELQRFEILVRSPNWLGDACMAIPTVRALKRGRPDARVTVLSPAGLAALWEGLPEVDEVIGKGGREGLLGVRRRVRRAAPEGGYDVAVLLPNSLRSGLEVWRLAGRVAGYPGHRRGWIVNQPMPKPKKALPPEHHALRYLRIAERLGAEVGDGELFRPGRALVPGEGERYRLGLAPGAAYGPAKCWPPGFFAEVANVIGGERLDVEWHIFGAGGDREMADEVVGALRVPYVDRVGKTGLAEFMEELRRCRLLLCNDSGSMHLAAALGVPTVAIFGSTSPELTGPMGEGHRILRPVAVPCSPCFARQCRFGHRDCLHEILPERAAVAVRELLERGVV
jgi:heptosyltransferase II